MQTEASPSGTEPIPMTSYDVDTMITVGLAMDKAAMLLIGVGQIPAWVAVPLGIVGAGLLAWQAKRSPGKHQDDAATGG